jgi:KDO2-lipid IV(A) lauroyltransferase
VRATNPGACKDDQAVDMMRQLNELFEDWIRQQPEDWYCTKRIWPKHRPGSNGNTRRERA